jgi:hypothetical protein
MTITPALGWSGSVLLSEIGSKLMSENGSIELDGYNSGTETRSSKQTMVSQKKIIRKK